MTVRCPYCAQISLENSFKTAHLTHCHHMNGDKNPILIPKPEYPLDYEEFTNPPTHEQNVGEKLASRFRPLFFFPALLHPFVSC